VDPPAANALHAALKSLPGVAAVGLKRAALESLEKTLAENIRIFTALNVFFAGIIAFGVVYNTARIALAERSWELATLRVLGLTRREISSILLGELALLTAAAIPAGLGLGHLMARLAVRAFETEVYRIPLVIYPKTYLFSALVVTAAAAFSALVVRRRLDRLDLVAVLKTRE
jgi:putative ABC transport system permease protein